MLRYCLTCILLIALTACSRIPIPETPSYKSGEAATVVRMQLLHTADMGMLPLIRVKVGPQFTGWWLLDTGSSHNLIDDDLAAQLALTRASSSAISTIGGRKASTHYQLPALQIGKLKLDGQSASALDLSALSASDSYRVNGVLGMPALANLVLGLDYHNRTVRFSNSSRKDLGRNQLAVPFTLNRGVPVARLQLDGGKRVGNFILDTGNAAALVILPSLRELKRDQPLHFVEMADLGGSIPTQLARLSTLTLGGRQFRNIPVALPLNSQHSAGVDGSLGNGILARQEVVFDFPQRRLLLNSFGQQSADLAGDFGFLLTPDGYISVVNDHSPAAKAVLRRGDRIMAVAGREVVNEDAHTIWQLLNQRQQVQLTVLRAATSTGDTEIIENKQSLGREERLLIRLQRNHYLPLL